MPGVISLSGNLTRNMRGLLAQGREARGVKLHLEDNTMFVDVWVTVAAGANVMEVGREIQRRVAEAVRTMVGMMVQEVNVHIQEVRQTS